MSLPTLTPQNASALRAAQLQGHCSGGEQLYALIDAAHPQAKAALAEAQFQTPRLLGLFQGMAEQEAQAAGPYLLALNPAEEIDLARIARLDLAAQQAPCVSWLWSAARPDALFAHLQQQLVASLPDGGEALLRFYDPRVLTQLFAGPGLDAAQRAELAGPVTRWQWQAPGARAWVHAHHTTTEEST